MRNPKKFISSGSAIDLAAFQLIVGGKIWSMFINPIMWIVTIVYFSAKPWAGEFIESFFSPGVFYMAILSMTVGNFLYLYYYMIGCAKREQNELIKYTFLVPIYWLMMSAAAWVALYRLIKEPHHWAKTKHGLHLKQEAEKKDEEIGKFWLPSPNWDLGIQ